MIQIIKDTESRVLSPRISALKERALRLEDSYAPGERFRLATQFYRGHNDPSDAPAVRQAKCLAYILRNCEIKIHPFERIVGLQNRYISVHQGISEGKKLGWAQMLDAPEVSAPGALPPGAPDELADYCEFWKDKKSLWRRVEEIWRAEKNRQSDYSTLFSAGISSRAHPMLNYREALGRGLKDIIAECDERLLSEAAPKKRAFYEAVKITLDAAIHFSKRYARLAREMAEDESNPQRQRKIPPAPFAKGEEIAANCETCLEFKPSSFYQALQTVWFLHWVLDVEIGNCLCANSFGRFDQYLFEFYEHDIRQGVLVRTEALELVEEFFIKRIRIYEDQHTMVGGLRPDGASGVNELTYLVLEAFERLDYPFALGARVFTGMSDKYLQRVTDMMLLSKGISIFNDNVSVPAIASTGLTAEEARDYAVTGCVEYFVAGVHFPRTLAITVNLLKCLELTLNGSVATASGERLGQSRKVLDEYASFDELLDAFYGEIEHAFNLAAEKLAIFEWLDPEVWPLPFMSAFYPSCLEKGVDISAGGAKTTDAGVAPLAFATTVDSLSAIKRTIFEERVVSADELREALENNFNGYEALRAYLCNRTPKYGNDDPAADELASEVMRRFYEIISKRRNYWGGQFTLICLTTTTATVYNEKVTGRASADGRLAGSPVSLNLTPSPGAIRNGISAAIMSATSIDHKLFTNGCSFVVECHPSHFKGTQGRASMRGLIRTFVQNGGMNLGINLVDAETLKKAKAEPEQYRSLTVRLFGYSDYFNNLSETLKEALIEKAQDGKV